MLNYNKYKFLIILKFKIKKKKIYNVEDMEWKFKLTFVQV